MQINHLQEVVAKSEANINVEVAQLKQDLASMTISNEKLTEEVGSSVKGSWNILLNEKMK